MTYQQLTEGLRAILGHRCEIPVVEINETIFGPRARVEFELEVGGLVCVDQLSKVNDMLQTTPFNMLIRIREGRLQISVTNVYVMEG